MSYVVPSVNVYQQLENAGGVLNSTPDLEACIIGPAYNVLRYVAGSTPSLVKTAATAAASALGSTVAGSPTVTFEVIPPFSVGDTLLIPGADVAGALLSAKVIGATGAVLTLDSNAVIAVKGALIRKQGLLVNPSINNTFNLPSQKAGQIVDAASIQIFANQAKVQTISTGVAGFSGNNALTYYPVSGTVTTTASSAVISSVTNYEDYREGDTVTITGAGVSGVDLTAKVLIISGANFTLDTPVATSGVALAMRKATISNVSAATSTLLIEAGDEVLISYVNNALESKSFTSTVIGVVSATGTLSNVTIADVLPNDACHTTTATTSIASGATTLTLTSSTGFEAGDTILIKGAGADGLDHVATIGNITGAVISGLSPATVTATTSAPVVLKQARVTFKTRKLFNNQLVPLTKPLTGGSNYSTTNTAVDGTVTINAAPEVAYGKLISGTIHIAYRALRTDLSAAVLAIANQDDNLGVFGEVSEDNPLALAVSIALSNTTTRVRAVAIKTNDPAGYFAGLDLAQGERVYALVPLTQEESVVQAFSLHAQGMSTPENAMWRIAIANTKIPTKVAVGTYTEYIVNVNAGNNSISVAAGKYVLTSSNSTFISDNVTPGDTLNITAGVGSPTPVGTMEILEVVSNQQIVVQASGTATGVSFFITRTLSKTQRADAVAARSKTFGSNRLIHVQPDTVVINVGGRNVVLPGYYLCAAVAGLVAGFPSQQGFTNIGIAGVSDLSNSNFTFTRAQLNKMASNGTFLFVQETAGSIPYVRHELTTDITVYEYRELQAVKNWDFLSYFYYDKLGGFIGKWNITSDTMGVVRQTIVASTELIKAKKLPRIGAPLIDGKIDKLEQNKFNKDQLDVRLKIQMPYVLNYLNMYLVI